MRLVILTLILCKKFRRWTLSSHVTITSVIALRCCKWKSISLRPFCCWHRYLTWVSTSSSRHPSVALPTPDYHHPHPPSPWERDLEFFFSSPSLSAFKIALKLPSSNFALIEPYCLTGRKPPSYLLTSSKSFFDQWQILCCANLDFSFVRSLVTALPSLPWK